MDILKDLLNTVNSGTITTKTIIITLLMISIASAYEYIIYRCFTKNKVYNKSFNLVLVVSPYFIATIILCLQSNSVITLGTIGALAIIRFRTAIKDPVDMVYLLWSIHNGIMVGCQMYKVAILTSLVVTIVIIALTYGSELLFKQSFYMLAINTEKGEKEIIDLLKSSKLVTKINVINRSYHNKTTDFVIEIKTKNIIEIQEYLKNEKGILSYSLFNNDSTAIS